MKRFILLLVALLSLSVRASSQQYVTAGSSSVTNQPQTFAMPFIQGDIQNCVLPYFTQQGGTSTAISSGSYQTDVRKRWPDGSLKFAQVTFIIPSLAATAKGVVQRYNTTSCNNTGFLTPTQMLSATYNFDAQIRLTGAVNHNISARAILTAANAGAGCGNIVNGDVEGALMQFECVYWQKGPVVTTVILEDRAGRSFDVNTDGGSGNPLHPIFECSFYPQTSQVECDYALEDIWASATPSLSARDQTYSYVLTAGNSPSQTVFCSGNATTQPTLGPSCTAAAETVITRTRWHHRLCANGSGPVIQNGCTNLTIDNNWGYTSQTQFYPLWDTDFGFHYTGTGIPTPANFSTAWNSTSTNKSDVLNDNGTTGTGLGFLPGGHSGCGNSTGPSQPPPSGVTGDGCGSSGGMNQGGAAYYHGPQTTWDITTLITGSPIMLPVTFGETDVSGGYPIWFREADSEAALAVSSGKARFFNSPSGTVSPTGRGISINARTQFDTGSGSQSNGSCVTNFTSEYVNYGGTGQDLGNWPSGFNNTDTSHWPETAYTSYILTGRYSYYEQEILQGMNAAANTYAGGGTCYAVAGHASWRQAAIGYGIYNNDQDREIAWGVIRGNALGATVALDGSPEETYFKDKLFTNLDVIAGANSIPCLAFPTGTINQINYCGSPGTLNGNPSAWSYGNTIRNSWPYIGDVTGTLFSGTTAYVGEGGSCGPGGATGNCTPAFSADSNFQNAYTAVMMGWVDDLGFCPHNASDVCPLVQWEVNHYINLISDQNGPGQWVLSDYVIPTSGGAGSQGITNVGCATTPCTVASGSLYPYYGDNVVASSAALAWPRPALVPPASAGDCADEGYPAETMAGLSYGYLLISTANSNVLGTYNGTVGFSGANAYNTWRATVVGSCYYPANSRPFDQSPKWNITPRKKATLFTTAQQASPPSFSPPAGTYASTQTVTITSSTNGVLICYTKNGNIPTATAAGTCDTTVVGEASLANGGSLAVNASETINAIATLATFMNSLVSSATYTIGGTLAAPTFSPVAGTYVGTQTVTITATAGATICYRIGTAPAATTPGTCDVGSTTYSGPVSIAVTGTLEALATEAGGFTNSSVATALYTIQQQLATPTFSPVAGNYLTTQVVTITEPTNGAAVLCYTLNGSIPTESGNVCTGTSLTYAGSISVSSTLTINVLATLAGFADSAIGTARYIIGAGGVPTFAQHQECFQAANSASLNCTYSSPVGLGDGLMLAIGTASRTGFQNSFTSCTDNVNGAWTKYGEASAPSAQNIPPVAIFYLLSSAAGTVTVTCNYAQTNNMGMSIVDVIPSNGGVLFVDTFTGSSTNLGTTGSSTQTGGPITTSSNNDFIFVATDFGGGNFVNYDQQPGWVGIGNISSADIADEYFVQTTAGSISGTFTSSTTFHWSAIIAPFGTAGGANLPQPPTGVTAIVH